jgi:hypothetical protein
MISTLRRREKLHRLAEIGPSDVALLSFNTNWCCGGDILSESPPLLMLVSTLFFERFYQCTKYYIHAYIAALRAEFPL